MGDVRRGRPLPLAPAGSVEVNQAVWLFETDEGGVVFIWGMAAWCWESGDAVGRRLAAVQLVETRAATVTEVAAGFDVDWDTVRRWRGRYAEKGLGGLEERRRGPKGPIKLDVEMVARIGSLSSAGMGLRAIGREVGLDPSTVRRALGGAGTVSSGGGGVERRGDGAKLERLARPVERTVEREMARAGLLAGAEPQICEGAGLPLAGSLLVLPALAATGLVEAFEAVYVSGRAAFYSLRSLVLAVVFCVLVGEPRAEGLTRIDPVDLGRLIGLDRAPEVRTLRSRMQELAGAGRSDLLVRRLAEVHLAEAGAACGMFYIDGHVRAYHGQARLPKAHLARARISAPAEVDTWIGDQRGDGLLVWTADPGASLAGELKRATGEIRALVGPDATPTVVFDRGGWSPKCFAQLSAAGFEVLTYRKEPVRPEPTSRFVSYEFIDDLGRRQKYLLADRPVRIGYTDDQRKKRRLSLRQITRLDPDSGHQTQIVTTRVDLPAAEAAFAMFSRWRQENFFRYMRANYGLDALDSYAKTADDPDRSVPNPAKASAKAAVREAQTALAAAKEHEGAATLDRGRDPQAAAEIKKAFSEAEAELARRQTAASQTPARVPLGEIHPDAQRLHPERKRIHDAIRMAVYNATSSLARLLAPHYARADDEARMVLNEAFRAPADLQIVGDELHVRINPLSAPRRSRAIAAICEDLNATDTLYPGTKLRLVYSIKPA
jgi:transposase